MAPILLHLPLTSIVLLSCSPQRTSPQEISPQEISRQGTRGTKASTRPTRLPTGEKTKGPESTPSKSKTKNLWRAPVLIVQTTRVAEEQWSIFRDGSLWKLRFDRGRILEEAFRGKSSKRLLEARRVASLLRILAKDPRSRRKDPQLAEALHFRFLLGEKKEFLSFERPERAIPKSLRKRITALCAPQATPKNERPILQPSPLPSWIARAKPYAKAMGLDPEEAKDIRSFLKKQKLPFSKPSKGSFAGGEALAHPWFFWPVEKPGKAGEWVLEFKGHFLLTRIYPNPHSKPKKAPSKGK